MLTAFCVFKMSFAFQKAIWEHKTYLRSFIKLRKNSTFSNSHLYQVHFSLMTLSTPWKSCSLIHWILILWILHFKLADILNLVFISAELKPQLSELQQYLGDQIQHSYLKKKRRELGSFYEQGNLTSGGNLDCCFRIFYEWSRSKNGREPTFKIKPVNPIHDRFKLHRIWTEKVVHHGFKINSTLKHVCFFI